MPERSHLCAIQAPAHLRAARQNAVSLAAAWGFREEQLDLVALLTGELASNLVGHAGGGNLILRRLSQGRQIGLEVLSIDRGPGMADVQCCLRDGYSTAGTLGTGLGVVCRLSSQFDLYSRPGQGTVLMSRLWRPPWNPRDGSRPEGLVQTDSQGLAGPLRSRTLAQGPDGMVVCLSPPKNLPGPLPDLDSMLSGARGDLVQIPGQALLVDSGCLPATWNPTAYPHVLSHHPSLLAGLLFRDHGSPERGLTIAVVPS